MRKAFLAACIALATLMVASSARADPIAIVENVTGVGGSALVIENGVTETVGHQNPLTGPDSFHLSVGLGSSSAEAAAALVSNFSDPLRLFANGSTSVSYNTQVGLGGGAVASEFFVLFELDRPRGFMFDGDFVTSGDAFDTPLRSERSGWRAFLRGINADGSTRVIIEELGIHSMSFVRDGVLSAGLYSLFVNGTSSAIGGPAAAGNVFSNFAFNLQLKNETPAPVPEPGSLLLVGTGLGALVAVRQRKRSTGITGRTRGSIVTR